MPCNEMPWFIYLKVAGQLRLGPAGAHDLDYLALKYVMDLYGVTNQLECFELVTMLAQHMIQRAHKK